MSDCRSLYLTSTGNIGKEVWQTIRKTSHDHAPGWKVSMISLMALKRHKGGGKEEAALFSCKYRSLSTANLAVPWTTYKYTPQPGEKIKSTLPPHRGHPFALVLSVLV